MTSETNIDELFPLSPFLIDEFSVLYHLDANNHSKGISEITWVFFTFLKLYKWYRIAQRTTYCYEIIDN